MKLEKTLRKLKIHKSWDKIFINLFSSLEMKELKEFLSTNKYIPQDIFRVFRMSMYDIRAVILGDFPKVNSNGLSYGSLKWTKESLKFVNKYELDLYLIDFETNRLDNINSTLEFLEEKGIFLLNLSLTAFRTTHYKYWKFFTDKIIKELLLFNNIIWVDTMNILPNSDLKELDFKKLNNLLINQNNIGI